MLYHLASNLSTRGALAQCEENKFEESESEEMTRVSLSHSQRDHVAQELTFCRNIKKKTGIIRGSDSIFSFPFLFQEKKMVTPLPYARYHFSLKFSTDPLNNSREKERRPSNHQSPPPLPPR